MAAEHEHRILVLESDMREAKDRISHIEKEQQESRLTLVKISTDLDYIRKSVDDRKKWSDMALSAVVTGSIGIVLAYAFSGGLIVK